MSGWDQEWDNDPDKGDDVELAWLLIFTVLSILGVGLWLIWPVIT